MKTDHFQTGATDKLNLRVSVAVLVRMIFKNPADGKIMLALERTATLLKQVVEDSEVAVRSKPFGGAVLLLNPDLLQEMIGAFNYDSERSLREGDFRIMIQPSSWNIIKKICHDHFRGTEKGILDYNPWRELEEELEDSLHVKITAGKFKLQLADMIIENVPRKTKNMRAPGMATVRIYYIYEAVLQDQKLITTVLESSDGYSDVDLQELARQNRRQGGRGRANAVLALPLNEVFEKYRSVSDDKRRRSIHFNGHLLDGNVWAIIAKNNTKDNIRI